MPFPVAHEIELQYEHDGSVSNSDVRDALNSIKSGDVTDLSPLGDGGGRNVGTVINDDHIILRVQGHAGLWIGNSLRKLQSTIEQIDGIRPGSDSIDKSFSLKPYRRDYSKWDIIFKIAGILFTLLLSALPFLI